MTAFVTGIDHAVAAWFQAHMTLSFAALLGALSEPGSGGLIATFLFFGLLFCCWKRAWPALLQLMAAVPGGMLLNELLKLLVQRPRPLLDGPIVDWSGYSFASGHTIGATLLFGQMLIFAIPLLESRSSRRFVIALAVTFVCVVGFGRVALGAHYLTDVLAAIAFGILWLAFCSYMTRAVGRDSALSQVEVQDEAVVLVPVPVLAEAESGRISRR
jgi:membrane-associated phospholipid phosphatase